MSPRRCAGAGRRVVVSLAAALVAAAPAVARPPAAAAGTEVVIEAGALRPFALRITAEERLEFVNRSGRLVHVEFLGAPTGHRVFHIPDRIWAVFHRPGSHRYVVHVRGDRPRGLHGVIEVVNGSRERELPVCGGALTVMGECLER